MSNNDNLCIQNFGNICRTCLAGGELKFLYEKCSEEVCLVEMLTSITFVQFSENDGLPVQICLNCVSELTRAYRFSRKSLKADKKLRECFKEYENKINSKIQSDSQAENFNLKISTDKLDQEIDDDELKTEIEVEEHKVEINPEVVLIKHEMLSENDTDNNENLSGDESDSNKLNFFPDNDSSDSIINDKQKKENYSSKQVEQSTKKQKLLKIKAPPYECKKCFEKFGTYKLLSLHKKEVKHQNVENCKICSKSIVAYNMPEHMRLHSGEKPFCCEVCGKKFSLKKNLTRHFKLHTGEKPHKCTVCEKSFIQSTKLKEHMSVHSGERPYVCNYCEKTFAVKANLDLHMKMHTGEKPYKCTFCEKGYIQYTSLKMHLRTHTGEKPYNCNICGKAFSRPTSVKAHLKTHSEEKPQSSEAENLYSIGFPRPKIENLLEKTVTGYDENKFFEHFRVSRQVAENLARKFKESDQFKYHFGQHGKLTALNQVHIFLWFAGHQTASFRDVANKFNVSISSLYRIIRRVVIFLSNLSPEVITWPTENEKKVIEQNFNEGGFPGVIGAIGGFHIKIDNPQNNNDSYINRNGYCSIQMQIVCDHQRRIRDIFVGHPGSVNDITVFRDSPLYNHLQEICGPYFILGDNGFPLQKNLLTPFRDRGQLNRRQINYNEKLSENRYIIKHCFSSIKQKFRQLCHIKLKDIECVVHFIRAMCVLHNTALDDNFAPTDVIDPYDNLPDVTDEDDENVDDKEATIIRDDIVNRLRL